MTTPITDAAPCPGCQQLNAPNRTFEGRSWFKCARCRQDYYCLAALVNVGPPAPAVATPTAPARKRGRSANAAKPCRAKRPTPFRKMPAEKKAAIREMLYRVKARYYGVEL